MSEEQMKKRILEALNTFKYGLTLDELSDRLKLSRATVSKYIAVLKAENSIVIRKIGNAKLAYIPKHYEEGG
ncbi:MAG: HTH domain-containing protein [Candidatus Aenigmarchaeota archaeon]|nr:HTH domain-containing protein [Candidatus Aenigmarchaeota archaeon]